MPTTCRWCGLPIRWVRTPAGRDVAINPRPDRWGDIVIPDVGSDIAWRRKLLPAWTGLRWMSHAVTCAHNGSFRLTKRKI